MLAIIEHAGLFGFAIGLIHHAPFAFVKAKLGLGAHDIRPGAAVGKTRMHRIHAVLDALQPVAVLKTLDCDVHVPFADEKIVARHERYRRRTEVSEDQPAQLFDRIGRQANIFFSKRTARRFARNLHQLAVGVIEPAVVATANAIALDVTETKIGAPVRTESADHTRFSRAIAKENEIFAEDTDESRLHFQVRRNTDGPPVAAQEFTHRRAAPGARESLIFFFAGFVHDYLARSYPPRRTRRSRRRILDRGDRRSSLQNLRPLRSLRLNLLPLCVLRVLRGKNPIFNSPGLFSSARPRPAAARQLSLRSLPTLDP